MPALNEAARPFETLMDSFHDESAFQNEPRLHDERDFHDERRSVELMTRGGAVW